MSCVWEPGADGWGKGQWCCPCSDDWLRAQYACVVPSRGAVLAESGPTGQEVEGPLAPVGYRGSQMRLIESYDVQCPSGESGSPVGKPCFVSFRVTHTGRGRVMGVFRGVEGKVRERTPRGLCRTGGPGGPVNEDGNGNGGDDKYRVYLWLGSLGNDDRSKLGAWAVRAKACLEAKGYRVEYFREGTRADWRKIMAAAYSERHPLKGFLLVGHGGDAGIVLSNPYINPVSGGSIYAHEYVRMPLGLVLASIQHCHSACVGSASAYVGYMGITDGQFEGCGRVEFPPWCHDCTVAQAAEALRDFCGHFFEVPSG